MTNTRTLIATALMLACTSGAMAQTAPEATQQPPNLPPEIKALSQYINSPGYVSRVSALIQGGEKDVAPDCNNSEVKSWIGLQVIQQPMFSGDHPLAGAWRDQILVNRCGKRIVYNVLAVAHPTEPPGLSLMAPGDTVLPPKVQQDVLVAMDANLQKLTCATPDTLPHETRITKKLTPLKRNESGVIVEGQWVERWTVIHCGKYADANVNVSADGMGSARFTLTDLAVREEPKPVEHKPAKKKK